MWSLGIAAIALGFVKTGPVHLQIDRYFDFAKFGCLPGSRKIYLFLLSGPLLALVGILGVVALKHAPNNWDSMTYHLGRIVHWKQEQSVAAYATNITRQVQMQPLAEYMVAHLLLLTGSDHLANCVQWGAMLLSGMGVSLIAKQMGGNIWQQVGAAAVCWAIPMGVLQATSTQNDYVNAFWLVCFISIGISLLESQKKVWHFIPLGVGLGLALLTKATAYVYAFPFCMWFGFSILKKTPRRQLPLIALCILCPALLINSGHYLRNVDLYSSPLGPADEYANQAISIQGFSSNLIRNAAIHTSIPFLDTYNHFMAKGLEKLHSLTGLSPSDPRYTMAGGNPFSGESSLDEDYTGNPFHWALICLGLITGAFEFLFFGWDKKRAIFRWFNLSIWAGFGLLCLFVKWQPWISRLQLPLFVLWSPVISLALIRSKIRISVIIPFILIFMSFIWISYNPNRPAFFQSDQIDTPRTRQYFTKKPELFSLFTQIVDSIQKSGCHEVGLKVSEDAWEYPIWVMFADSRYPVTIQHIRVENPSKKLMPKNFKPCAIISNIPDVEFDIPDSIQNFGEYTLYLIPMP